MIGVRSCRRLASRIVSARYAAWLSGCCAMRNKTITEVASMVLWKLRGSGVVRKRRCLVAVVARRAWVLP